MEVSAQQAADQLRWWLRLPPTNLIERADYFRFRYALYLITHQVAAVLYGLNQRPYEAGYPSRLRNTPQVLNQLSIAPSTPGDRLLAMIRATDPQQAWAIASDLIVDTLRLTGDRVSTASPDTEGRPLLSVAISSLRERAEGVALPLSALPGVLAIAVSGSLARGLADDRSDIDLCLFCQTLTPEKDRYERLSRFIGTRDLLIEPACDTLWSGGVLVHIRYWLASAVTDLLARFPVPPDDNHLAEELQLCQAVYDPFGHLRDWQTRLRLLPKPLIAALYDQAFQRRKVFARCWAEASMDMDLIRLYGLGNQMVNDWLTALFALNNRFLSTPRWTHQEWARLTVGPDRADLRLAGIADAVGTLETVGKRLHEMDLLWDMLSEWRPVERPAWHP